MKDMLPKILIVDDQSANLAAFRKILDKVESEVIETNQGNEALILCLEHDFAVILLDVHMPGMDGYEVAQLLREDEQTRKIPIIFVTASYFDDYHRLKGYEIGAVDYIMKPIDERILLSKTQVFLELYNHRRSHELDAQLLNQKNRLLEKEINLRQQAETKLQEQYGQLEEMVKELQIARDQALHATEAKSNFLATMSHEIRTPMNGVLGMTHLLAETPLSGKQKLYVDTIKNSGEILITVINDVLDFSKIEADRIVLENIPFELENILKSTVHIFSKTGKEKGIGPHLQLFPGLPKVLVGDPNRLRQILFNLIGNAVKFTETGLVALFVQTIRKTDKDIDLKFCVDDTGIGIPSEKLKNLFTPFTQAETSTSRRYGGTGLGLAITAELIKLMGGTIDLQSQEGIGSSFRFEIPFTEPDEQKVENEDTAQSIMAVATPPRSSFVERTDSLEGGRILIVDDDSTNRLLLVELLSRSPFECVDVAVNGRDALEKFKTHAYDLILMDCQMPVMDGYEATRKIRQLEASGEKPGHVAIIALTASASSQGQEFCLAAGMDEYLPKPFGTKKLFQLMRHWLVRKDPSVRLEARVTDATQTTTEPEPELTLLNAQGFADLCRVMGEDRLHIVLQAFLKDLPGKLDALRKIVAQGDSEELHKKAHILKGNCGMLQASAMASLCQKLVDIGRSGDTQGAKEVFNTLETKGAESIKVFQELLSL